MGSSKAAILNLALTRANHEVYIDDPDDPNSAEAQKMAKLYDHVRKSMLREFAWACAQETLTLSPTAAYDPPDFGYAFEIPPYVLKIVRVLDPDIELSKLQYKRRGRFFCVDVDSLTFEYTRDVTDTTEFDDMFVDAFAFRLAAEYVGARDLELVGALQQSYALVLYNAQQASGRDSRVEREKQESIVDSRGA